MTEFNIECCIAHEINLAPNAELSTPGRDWQGRAEYVPRARERTLRQLDCLSVQGCDVPILLQRFTGITHGPNYDLQKLKIVSHETVIAAYRSGRPTDDLVYPFGIQRVEDGPNKGEIIGCEGFGILSRVVPRTDVVQAFTEEDLTTLPPPDQWYNSTNFVAKLYNPRLQAQGLEHDEVACATAPIWQGESAAESVDVYPHKVLDAARTEQFNAPIYNILPKEVVNFPQHDQPNINIVHPFAARHAALLGYSLRFCVTLGSLVRDTESKKVMGGRSLYVLDPHMLQRDGM